MMSEPSWMDPIWDYLVEGTLPSDPKEASKLRSRSARFTVHQGTLYKPGFSTPILKCVGNEDANYILREVHEGICGKHIGARTLAGKTLRQGYYWPTMLKDATELIRKCKACQEYVKISHLPSESLTSVTSPWPFQQRGLDILGPPTHWKGPMQIYHYGRGLFYQMGRGRTLSNNHRTEGTQLRLAFYNMQVGIPRSLVSDNRKQFDNPKFRDFCVELGIKNYYSSLAHPQSNGQA